MIHVAADRITRLIACGRVTAENAADEIDAQIIKGLCDELEKMRAQDMDTVLDRVREGAHRRIAALAHSR